MFETQSGTRTPKDAPRRKTNLSAALCLLCAALCPSFFSCSSDKAARTDAPSYTLIFLDKTRSVNTDNPFVADKYRRALMNIVEENIRHTGDKLDLYYVHDNTAKARALTWTVRTATDDLGSASPTDREAAEAEFSLALAREKTQLRQRVLAQLTTPNTGASNQATDLWASLPVIAKAAESGLPVRVYYLSDMRESVPNRPGSSTLRRDFEKAPPKDMTQADEWAKADAKHLNQYVLGSATVTLILPFAPGASARENNPAVTQYWQTLFTELGAAGVTEA